MRKQSQLNLKIPQDSILKFWHKILNVTEVPTSYQLSVGISAIGALLKRNIWIDQHASPGWGWNVYPNQSVMLVGPSGIGKDTAIDFATNLIDRFGTIPILGGRTIENVYQRMYNVGDPAAAYIPAGELTSFFGNKDYQSGMVQSVTDLLSTKDKLDISTKTDLISFGAPKIILRPTLTMHCGSTEEWLHKAMPDGTLEGGFLGRFLIIVEQLGGKHIPLVKHERGDKEEKSGVTEAETFWNEGVKEIVKSCQRLGEIHLLEEARESYTNWYYNRFKRFSKAVLPYANRSRDAVLRIAMLMAVSRMNFGWIEDVDIDFAVRMMDFIATRIDDVVLPPTIEAQAMKEILRILPATDKEIAKSLGRKYTLKQLENAKALAETRGDMEIKKGVWILG